ncbi:MAG: ABC transporter ATP-binding protein [Lachnospiraceae bacterium]|nr:ABC transporter ATP-binding protein [Lachnospiraceae bacterium]MCM1237172.1 ABC transporter ATP-binding protein [Ruminococcus flavefaciens]
MGDFREIGIKEWIMRHITNNYKVWSFKAVNHVSFELYRGDFLGIIGANGAGKSTLLKVIAQIMVPSEGRVMATQSISALLELGSGFDPDLTVKENTYLRGAMLGYTRKFMDDKYEEIIDYAELKEFQDYNFKQLSSGMQSRLAFAIASLVQPEILILDEVLSVGDGAFQEKSAGKMREIINNGAATILVSHSLDQIRKLCTKILWLHKGSQIAFGNDVKGICNRYQDFLDGRYIL